MNSNLFFSYKTIMQKLIIILFIAITCLPAQAGIKAVWTEKGISADIASTKFNDIKYISLTDLADFLESENFEHLRQGTGTLVLTNGEINYTLFSPYVTVGSKSYNIQHDILIYKGGFYAPLVNIISVVDMLISDDLMYSEKENSIGLFPALYNIIDLTAQQKVNGLLIEVLLSEKLKFDIVKTSDNWLVITIYKGKIDTAFFNGKRPSKAVYDTKAYQFDNSAQLSIRLRPRDFTFVSKLKENPLRVQIMVKGEGFADTVLAYSPDTNGSFKNNRIDVIVIDPGHGGEDNGAIGQSGLKEKDVNLTISKKVKKMLEEKGFYVILTRDDDRFIPLSDRTKIANEAGADMFISIHANASENRKARGFISFFLSDAKTDQARATAALENAAIKFESTESQKDYISDLDFILLDMVQSEFLKESSDLAAIIEQNITRYTRVDSRGVDQAGFFVLNKAYMPSVLIESAFISNKDDEKLLRKDDTCKDIARAITESISQFKQKYDKAK